AGTSASRVNALGMAAGGSVMRSRSKTSTAKVRNARPSAVADLPMPLRRVIRAAERECPRGHAGALRDLTRLAVRKVPARGIFDPTVRDEQDLFIAIDTVARRHLGQ